MIMLVIRDLEEPKKTCARNAHVSALVVRGMSSRKRENVKMDTEVWYHESGTMYRFQQDRKLEMFKGENMQRHMSISGSNGSSMQNNDIALQGRRWSVLRWGNTQ